MPMGEQFEEVSKFTLCVFAVGCAKHFLTQTMIILPFVHASENKMCLVLLFNPNFSCPVLSHKTYFSSLCFQSFEEKHYNGIEEINENCSQKSLVRNNC